MSKATGYLQRLCGVIALVVRTRLHHQAFYWSFHYHSFLSHIRAKRSIQIFICASLSFLTESSPGNGLPNRYVSLRAFFPLQCTPFYVSLLIVMVFPNGSRSVRVTSIYLFKVVLSPATKLPLLNRFFHSHYAGPLSLLQLPLRWLMLAFPRVFSQPPLSSLQSPPFPFGP